MGPGGCCIEVKTDSRFQATVLRPPKFMSWSRVSCGSGDWGNTWTSCNIQLSLKDYPQAAPQGECEPAPEQQLLSGLCDGQCAHLLYSLFPPSEPVSCLQGYLDSFSWPWSFGYFVFHFTFISARELKSLMSFIFSNKLNQPPEHEGNLK